MSRGLGDVYKRQAYCWGYNEYGQLGDGTTDDASTPVAVAGGLVFESVSPGDFHTCGITLASEAYCWGRNENGQLGVNSSENASEPTPVLGGTLFAVIDVGNAHTCGVTIAGNVYCWGNNDYGQLGFAGSATLVPTQVQGGVDYLQVTTGASFTCGIRGPGEGWCWGFNQSGQLGTPSYDECTFPDQSDPEGPPRTVACSLTPVRAAANLNMAAISSGAQHTCALTAEYTVYCWGSGTRGQLGNGSSGSDIYSTEPVLVSRQP